MRLKFVIALLAAGAVAVTFSGCFVLYGVDWSKVALKPGDKATETVKSHPFSHHSFKDTPFFFIGVPSNGALAVQGGKFDVTTQFVNHPKPLINDNALRDFIVNNFSSCGYPINTSNFSYRAFRTPANIKDLGKVSKTEVSKLNYKQVALVPNSDANESAVTVAAGAWSDKNHNGTPESGEVACGFGSAQSFLNLKRASSKNKGQASPKLRREAKRRLEGN